MTNSSPLLSVQGVTYRLFDKVILDNVTFALWPGEIITIIGPNGAGKTTLLKLILGLIKPTAGYIVYQRTLQVGYMPQKIDTNPLLPLTVERFLNLSQPDQVSPDFFNQTLHRVGIISLKKQSLKTLSGGEWQRVLLARALLRKPTLLILDEPAQGVDVVGQAEFYQLLSDLRDQLKCAILLVSHDLHLVMASTNHVICLNHHICCSGHPTSVMKDPKYHDLFATPITPGKVNILPYVHHHDHRHDGSCYDPT